MEGRKPWVLNVLMNQNSNECISMVEKNIKKLQVTVKKEFEKKRMIMESEVTANAYKGIKIDSVLETIKHLEEKLTSKVEHKTAQHLIALYNKAVEYYSAIDDERHVKYLFKLKDLMANEQLQAVMEVSDVGTVDQQSSTNYSVQGADVV